MAHAYSDIFYCLQPRCPGQEFFDLVIQTLQLLDSDYFDLEFEDAMGNKV